ncbi:prolyl 4-hydroxylase subunit alpha-1-like isoform X1 [Drosophila takahashii]|uniref:prolyl 4-hydroxylase subunit alpha-1-like isoform X1 n=1 Tax=Drosophila takahashii TaxID=29030 RepID=UPI001CF82F15|nr:prolyl 4-hydroxylase subunit alpha-1-like [Drosophila takahashii]
MESKDKQWWLLAGYVFLILILSSVVLGKSTKEKSHSLSLATMVPLLKLENKLINNLDNYTKDLEEKLQIIRSQIKVMRSENKKGRQDPISYLSNPLNSFSLIRRLNQDWIKWRKYMEQPAGFSQLINFDSWRDELPTQTDLWEACTGVIRIQSTYNLDIAAFVKGKINGKQYNSSMSCADILAVGKHLVKEKKTKEAIQWLQEVPHRLQKDVLVIPKHLAIEKEEVLKLLVETHLKEKCYTETLDLLDDSLELKPQDAAFMRLRKQATALKTNQANHTLEENKQKKVPIVDNYTLSCRGKINKPNRLKCFYNFTTTPFLRLAPLKMEEIGLNPYVLLYHEVLSAREISMLISKATKNMKIARIHNRNPKNKNKGRTAKAYWFIRKNNELTRRITRRIQDMTGFDLTDSEEFQVINYGIGGHYLTHSDYFNFASSNYTEKINRQGKVLGDRIATVLFYLTDVEQGGATAFPTVGYSVYPRAGTAIFWHNLDTNGNGDILTRHAACPVIVGSKWVMTEWIRERRQIFIRPCLPPAPTDRNSSKS